MKVIIIEDEKLSADRLSKLIEQYDPSVEIIKRIDTIKNSVSWFDSGIEADLAFMDIQLADGISFEIFEKCSVNIPVIFTTAYDQFAIRAFKVNSIDYLLKPIGFKELKFAIDKYKNMGIERNLSVDINKEVIQDTKEFLTNQFKKRFIVKVGEHLHTISVDNILCFFSQEKATFLKTRDNKKFLIDYPLEQLEMVVSPEKFFRINRKYLISIDSINSIVTYSNSRLKLSISNMDDDDIIVSRDKVNAFKEWLDM